MTTVRTARSLLAAAIGTLALAACGSQDDTVSAENASVSDVAEQVAKADLKPNPGRWESEMKITKLEMPGLPPEVQGMMQSRLGKAQTSISCLTKEQAEAADGEMFKPEQNDACTYEKFEMGSGKIAAKMSCADGGASQDMTMTGTYSDNAYAMKVAAEGQMEGKAVSMAMEVASKRVGDCDGTEES